MSDLESVTKRCEVSCNLHMLHRVPIVHPFLRAMQVHPVARRIAALRARENGEG